jgi:hypothetical protein
LQIKGKKNRASCADENVVSSISSFGKIPYNFIFNQLPYFSTFSIWSLVRKRASNWPAIGLQTLSILQLCPCKLRQKKILLAAGILAFTLDIQMEIS